MNDKKERIRSILAYEGHNLIENEKEKIRQREQDADFTEIRPKRNLKTQELCLKRKNLKNLLLFQRLVSMPFAAGKHLLA